MDEEKLNISIRKFLKGVGINSQRIIEKRIRDIVENDKNVNKNQKNKPNKLNTITKTKQTKQKANKQ